MKIDITLIFYMIFVVSFVLFFIYSIGLLLIIVLATVIYFNILAYTNVLGYLWAGTLSEIVYKNMLVYVVGSIVLGCVYRKIGGVKSERVDKR